MAKIGAPLAHSTASAAFSSSTLPPKVTSPKPSAGRSPANADTAGTGSDFGAGSPTASVIPATRSAGTPPGRHVSDSAAGAPLTVNVTSAPCDGWQGAPGCTTITHSPAAVTVAVPHDSPPMSASTSSPGVMPVPNYVAGGETCACTVGAFMTGQSRSAANANAAPAAGRSVVSRTRPGPLAPPGEGCLAAAVPARGTAMSFDRDDEPAAASVVW